MHELSAALHSRFRSSLIGHTQSFTRNNKHWLWLSAAFLFSAACDGSTQQQPYDQRLDPYEQLAQATTEAEATSRALLLVFGANWCPDCRKLDRAMNQPPIKATVEKNFVVLKVDIGNWDRNVGFTSLWETPVASGIPAVVLANTQYDILYTTKAGELANARNMGTDELLGVFASMAARLQPDTY